MLVKQNKTLFFGFSRCTSLLVLSIIFITTIYQFYLLALLLAVPIKLNYISKIFSTSSLSIDKESSFDVPSNITL